MGQREGLEVSSRKLPEHLDLFLLPSLTSFPFPKQLTTVILTTMYINSFNPQPHEAATTLTPILQIRGPRHGCIWLQSEAIQTPEWYQLNYENTLYTWGRREFQNTTTPSVGMDTRLWRNVLLIHWVVRTRSVCIRTQVTETHVKILKRIWPFHVSYTSGDISVSHPRHSGF